MTALPVVQSCHQIKMFFASKDKSQHQIKVSFLFDLLAEFKFKLFHQITHFCECANFSGNLDFIHSLSTNHSSSYPQCMTYFCRLLTAPPNSE